MILYKMFTLYVSIKRSNYEMIILLKNILLYNFSFGIHNYYLLLIILYKMPMSIGSYACVF